MSNKPQFVGKRVKLGELISKAKVERCGGRSFPVYSMTMHDGIVEQSGRFKKAIASKDTSAYKVVKKNQLVVGFPIDEGVIYVQNHDQPGIMSPAYNVWDFDSSRIIPAYLELTLHSPQSMAYYAEKLRGTTARRRSLTAEGLRALPINLPSIEYQRTVVEVLNGIKDQIAAAQKATEELDSLVKSQFVEMFGDPSTLIGRWTVSRLDGFTQIITGNTPSRKHPEYYGEGTEWIKTDNIVNSVITTAAEQLTTVGREKARIAPAGSILMACIAGSVNSIGKVGLLDREAAFNQQINAIVPGDKVDARFLLTMLSLSKAYLCSNVNQQLKGILNKSTLSAKQFPVPPLPLQQEFADFATSVDKSKFIAQQQIEKLQTLYDSLAQEYFS